VIAYLRLYRFRRASGMSVAQAIKPRMPRATLPRFDDDQNGAWWRGWWTGAPVFFVLGFALATALFKG
jgi:hypothetical protein